MEGVGGRTCKYGRKGDEGCTLWRAEAHVAEDNREDLEVLSARS